MKAASRYIKSNDTYHRDGKIRARGPRKLIGFLPQVGRTLTTITDHTKVAVSDALSRCIVLIVRSRVMLGSARGTLIAQNGYFLLLLAFDIYLQSTFPSGLCNGKGLTP